MRVTEKAVAILILALSAWAILMWAELGSDSAQLNQAVAANEIDGIAHNVQMVVRNTYMDYVFILLYWTTFLSLAVLAGRMGQRILSACSALLISGAALNDLLENGAILTAMKVKPFTDAVAVD